MAELARWDVFHDRGTYSTMVGDVAACVEAHESTSVAAHPRPTPTVLPTPVTLPTLTAHHLRNLPTSSAPHLRDTSCKQITALWTRSVRGARSSKQTQESNEGVGGGVVRRVAACVDSTVGLHGSTMWAHSPSIHLLF